MLTPFRWKRRLVELLIESSRALERVCIFKEKVKIYANAVWNLRNVFCTTIWPDILKKSQNFVHSILPPSRQPSPPLTLPEDGMLEKTQYANHVWKDKNVHISKFGSWFQDFLGFVTEIVARVVAQQTHTVHIQEPAWKYWSQLKFWIEIRKFKNEYRYKMQGQKSDRKLNRYKMQG